MTSHAAMITKIASLSPEDSVEKALKAMEKHGVSCRPVVDADKALQGVFSLRSLMKNMLPVSIGMGDGMAAQDVVIGAAPGIVKRFRNAQIREVEAFMDRDFPYVTPETPIWKTIDILAQYGDRLYVVDEKTAKLSGVITSHSALDELKRMQNEN